MDEVPRIGNLPHTARTAFLAVAHRWNIQDSDLHRLLGAPKSIVDAWFSASLHGESDVDEVPTSSFLERISHIVSIYDILHRLMNADDADRWIDQSNTAFGGEMPRKLLLSGSSGDLMHVRSYLEQIASQ